MSQIISGRRPKVFISYRRKPSAMLATLIASHLQENGIDPYVDTRESGGGPFPDRLLHAIQDSDVFVSLLADDTLESEWVLREIEHAHNLNKPMIPVFQESFVRPETAPNEHITALLRYDGVHILDVKNLYVDQAMDTLVRMIWQSIGSSPFASRRMLWVAGGVALIVVLFAIGFFISPMFGKVDTATPTSIINAPTATDTPTLDPIDEAATIDAIETATAVAPVIAQTRAYAQTRIAAYQTNVAATATATVVTATPSPQPSATLTPTEDARPPLVVATFVLATQAAIDFEVSQLVGTLDAGGSLSQLAIESYQQAYQISAENLIIANDAGAAPDINLRISSFATSPENPAPGQPFQLSVTVENTGTDDSGPFDIQWFASELLGDTFSQSVDNAAAGSSATLTFDYSYGWWGDYASTLWVDPANTVTESDETDNVTALTMTMSNEPIVIDFDTLPDGTPITPPYPLAGDEYLANNLVFGSNAADSECGALATLMIEALQGQNSLRAAPPCVASLLVQTLYPVGSIEAKIIPEADGSANLNVFGFTAPEFQDEMLSNTLVEVRAAEPVTLQSDTEGRGAFIHMEIVVEGQIVNLSQLTLFPPNDGES